MTVTQFINVALLGAALLAALVMIDHMSKATRGPIRWATILLAAGTLAEIVGYFFRWSDWTDTLFFGGVAMCLVSNIRGPGGATSEKVAERYAYAVGAATAFGLVISWIRA